MTVIIVLSNMVISVNMLKPPLKQHIVTYVTLNRYHFVQLVDLVLHYTRFIIDKSVT